jgi:hypothetical protein
MTVCIAAKCADGIIFGISDRMLTSGDIQFEPRATNKVLILTSSIVAMTAGDAAFNAEILRQVSAEVDSLVHAAPTEWLAVKDVAEMYAKYRNLGKLRRAEAKLLAPLGLDRATFIASQQQMNPDLVDRIAREMINYEVPYTSAIFTGVDGRGSTIYAVNDGEISCQDAVGFAVIGAALAPATCACFA